MSNVMSLPLVIMTTITLCYSAWRGELQSCLPKNKRENSLKLCE